MTAVNVSSKAVGILLFLLLVGCSTVPKDSAYRRFEMPEFNFVAAKSFVVQADSLPQVHNVSVVDLKNDGKEFTVNGQHIFTDLSYTDFPNFYNYRKRAAELNVDADALLRLLNTFHDINADTYRKTGTIAVFRVVTYLNLDQGYVFDPAELLQPGDAIPYSDDIPSKLYIKQKMESGWYQYSRSKD